MSSRLCFRGASETQAVFVQIDLLDVPHTGPGVHLIVKCMCVPFCSFKFQMMDEKEGCLLEDAEKHLQTVDDGHKCRNLATRESLCDTHTHAQTEGLPLEKRKQNLTHSS